MIRDEDWSLGVTNRHHLRSWPQRLWAMRKHYHQISAAAGGAGVGYGAPAAAGWRWPTRSTDACTVTFQPDGDLMYAPGVLWTAAHRQIPILYVMHNNHGYHQEVMHLQRMAALHDRRPDQAWIGTTLRNPDIDFALLARAHGVWSEGPITDPAALGPALKRAVAVVKSGAPALVDVSCQPR